MTGSDDADEAVETAADQLYAAPLDDFMTLRTTLAKAAKADGDAATAKAITALRKPTVSAAVVNRFALHDPSSVERLTELGDRLRRAHHDLDAALLRELSTERRALVAEITASAFAHDGDEEPPGGRRDEVSASFDAAVADPEIASRLGRLVRPEQFSGFGIAPGPGLTLVQGGSRKAAAKPAKTPTPERTKESDVPPATATSRRLTRTAEKARTAFAEADERLGTADATEQRVQEQVRTLTTELGELQKELDEAKHELDRARKEARTAKSKRREAQSALDRAERQLND